MIEQKETTLERIAEMVHPSSPFDLYDVAVSIAAEIDKLQAELRTANAEVARLMPLPEIYTLWKKIIEDGNPSRDTVAHFVELAHKAAERAATSPADLRTPTDQRIAALEAQLAEARAFISTIIDAPNDYPAEQGM